jgi:cyclase
MLLVKRFIKVGYRINPMEIHELSPGVIAFIRPEGGANVGLIQTTDGIVVIDTTSRESDIRAFLTAVGVSPSDVRLVCITHSHNDHTKGIPLFDCPILAHKLTHHRIAKRKSTKSKGQLLPTEVFEDRRDIEIGDMRLEFIHAGGHTPGSSVVWLPEVKVLFAGDLIFEGRYPFLATANVPDLMKALKWLLTLTAQVIVPGHGMLCGEDTVAGQLDYIETSWARTADHIAQGHSFEEILEDSEYSIYPGLGAEKLHNWNIKVMYRQLKQNLILKPRGE